MNEERAVVLLDGPMGTELLLRGVNTPLPGWSAEALRSAPEVVETIHGDYAAAGAVVHTTATFRTRPEAVGEQWRELARLAVAIARRTVPSDHLIAGSVAPLSDCYRPDLSPPPKRARREHQELCRVLAGAGVDLILCETFADIDEGLIAVECAIATGRPTWAAFTPGPDGTLLDPGQVAAAGAAAVERGARAALVNCVAADLCLPYVEALASAIGDTGARIGVYANAGAMDAGVGWGAGPEGAIAYAGLAERWVEAGATIIGGCCGTGPGHIAELRRSLARSHRLASPGPEVLSVRA